MKQISIGQHSVLWVIQYFREMSFISHMEVWSFCIAFKSTRSRFGEKSIFPKFYIVKFYSESILL